MYNFDEIVNRRHSASVKWDLIEENNYPKDIIPMWVADMDFKTLPDITQAIQERASNGVYGYTQLTDEYLNAIKNWMKTRHQWDIEKDWIVVTPGVVTALKMAVNTYTQPNDNIIIQKPVYYPFDFSIELNDRNVIENEMKFVEDHYEIDAEDLQK